jgi:hypothetical protein
MDPDGNIYDMQGNFIGTANTQELEELDDDAEVEEEEEANII